MVRILALVQVLRSSTFARNEGDCWVLVCTSKRPINCEKSSQSVCGDSKDGKESNVRASSQVLNLRAQGDCWVLICTSNRPINCEKFE